MMQGDSYGIPVEIKKSDGTLVTGSDVADVEITIGPFKKTMRGGAVSYSIDSSAFIFPLSQSETFKLLPKLVDAQVRVLWPDGGVEGVSLGQIRVTESISKEVLSS